MAKTYINTPFTTESNAPIGGNFAVLQVQKDKNDKYHWWIDRERHFETAQNARNTMKPGRADNIREWLLERTATISDDGTTAVVDYAMLNYTGEKIGTAKVTWKRGRTFNGVDELIGFKNFGAGIGYEGSDYVVDLDVSIKL